VQPSDRSRVSLGNVFRMSGSVLRETEEGADVRRLDLEVRGVIDVCARMETKLHQTIEHVNRRCVSYRSTYRGFNSYIWNTGGRLCSLMETLPDVEVVQWIS
jgi:hypothetical protein